MKKHKFSLKRDSHKCLRKEKKKDGKKTHYANYDGIMRQGFVGNSQNSLQVKC